MIKKSFTDKARQTVYQGIDKLEAQVRIAQGIPVGEDQGNRQQSLPFLPLRPFFAGQEIMGGRLALAHRVHITPARKGNPVPAVAEVWQSTICLGNFHQLSFLRRNVGRS